MVTAVARNKGSGIFSLVLENIIWKFDFINFCFRVGKINFDKFNYCGGPHEKLAVATCHLGNHPSKEGHELRDIIFIDLLTKELPSSYCNRWVRFDDLDVRLYIGRRGDL